MNNPRHIAIIMDGNGRWAQKRGHNRYFGHMRGAKVARDIIEHCANLNIPYLTLFTFSTENWKRPQTEVSFLMKLLIKYLKAEVNKLIENNIKFKIIGDPLGLPENVQSIINDTIRKTQHNTGMILTFALNYGGKQDITEAVKRLVTDVQNSILDPKEINEQTIENYFVSKFLPDPDLIIRTSNEQRLSNFFLWQAAYSEFHFSPKLWPDFTVDDLNLAVKKFAMRERRFGQVSLSSHSNPTQPAPSNP